jgi:hypothetical protein
MAEVDDGIEGEDAVVGGCVCAGLGRQQLKSSDVCRVHVRRKIFKHSTRNIQRLMPKVGMLSCRTNWT